MSTPPPDVGINRDGFGDVDMWTLPTWTIANKVLTSAHDYDMRWRALLATITALEEKVGGVVQFDMLSGAFRENYNPASEQLIAQQAQIVEGMRAAGNNGITSVDHYLATDSQVAQRMGQV